MSSVKDQSKSVSKQQLTYFEKQRDALITEITVSMDSVLNNMNALNRALEANIAVGKEFDSVANLWSNFYDGLSQVEQLRQQQQQDEKGEEEDQQMEDQEYQNEQQGTQEQSNDHDLINEEQPTTQETVINEE